MNLVKSKPGIIGGGTRPTISAMTRGGIWTKVDTNDPTPVSIQNLEGAPKFDVAIGSYQNAKECTYTYNSKSCV